MLHQSLPVVDPNSSEVLALVVLQDRATESSGATSAVIDASAIARDGNLDSPSLAQMLEHELKSTRDELQTTIEEMESFNEELQSSNEELESAKEELQSLNEELSTVNCQLLEKVGELDKSTSEITNLMASTRLRRCTWIDSSESNALRCRPPGYSISCCPTKAAIFETFHRR